MRQYKMDNECKSIKALLVLSLLLIELSLNTTLAPNLLEKLNFQGRQNNRKSKGKIMNPTFWDSPNQVLGFHMIESIAGKFHNTENALYFLPFLKSVLGKFPLRT